MDKGSMMEAEAVQEEVMDNDPMMDEGSTMEEEVVESIVPSKVTHTAQAVIAATQEGSLISGTVDFIETKEGVQVVASLSNVDPSGNYGIHIHAEGSCEEGGNAAGGHFNPAGTQHGLLSQNGYENAHAGDMGNIWVNASGDGSLVMFLPGLSLSKGKNNIAGKAVIVHEKEDDFSQPTGNAGGRIGCGIIDLNK
jgi:Cu-Zn family superoxide dismutase